VDPAGSPLVVAGLAHVFGVYLEALILGAWLHEHADYRGGACAARRRASRSATTGSGCQRKKPL